MTATFHHFHTTRQFLKCGDFCSCKGDGRQREESRLNVACRLNRTTRGERGRLRKREGPRVPDTDVVKMAELHRDQAGRKGRGSQAPGREMVRVGGGVRIAGRGHRY